MKQAVLAACRERLTEALGTPPERFDWSYRDAQGNRQCIGNCTPQRFLAEQCAYAVDDYITVMHHPSERWTSPMLYHEIEEVTRRDPALLMLAVEDAAELSELVTRQLESGEQVVFAADVRYASDRAKGLLDPALEEEDDSWSKADAIAYKEIKACHVMSIDGLQRDAGGGVAWFRVQDSHGTSTGTDGHYRMRDAWLRRYGLSAVIRKALLSERLTERLCEPAVYMPKSERF